MLPICINHLLEARTVTITICTWRSERVQYLPISTNTLPFVLFVLGKGESVPLFTPVRTYIPSSTIEKAVCVSVCITVLRRPDSIHH